MRSTIIYLLLFFMSIQLQAQTYTPATVPNVKTQCASCYVSNPDNILSPQAEQELNAAIAQLQRQTTVELAIVVLNSIGHSDNTMFAHELFNLWQLGAKDKNNGLLISFIADQRNVRVEVGVGLEGILTDARCKQLLEETIFPDFRRNNYPTGFKKGVAELNRLLTTQASLQELLLETSPRTSQAVGYVANYLMVSLLVFIALIWLCFYQLRFSSSASNNVLHNYYRRFYNQIKFFGYIFPIPCLALTNWVKSKGEKARRKPIVCGECRATMQLLSEQEEDKYLSESEQEEERAESVDYDVWECKSCLNHIILPYEKENSHYTTCPQCKTKTYHLHANVVRMQATQHHDGKGERTYECRHCHYRKVETYRIAQLPKPPVVVVGGVGSRGGFGSGIGGGFSGGSWGGGFSGGGGASGSF